MQWGHGEQDYSAVLRKYLYEPAPGFDQETPIAEANEPIGTEEALAGSAEAATENLQRQETGVVVSQESLLSFRGPVSATTPADPPARGGFLRQLLSRFSSGQE